MKGFNVLFKYGLKKRIKDSFLISYGVMFPLLIILILGYISKKYYSVDSLNTSYFYYTIVSIPLCTFLSSITLIYVAREESLLKCGERFILAPVSRVSIVLSKIIPSTIAIAIFNCFILLITHFIFKVDFRGRFLAINILLVVLAFMSCALGTFIGLCSKDFMTVKNFVSTPILIMGLLGGAFFPIASLGGFFESISYVSPLTWINRGIFAMLLDKDMSIYYIAISICLVMGIVFTMLSVKKFKKEAFI